MGVPEPFVSRAGRKLDAAITAFGVDVKGTRAVDVGASTGGFTDCLLSRGAAAVTAVDVGHGQMHWRIRSDSRVTVVERTNIRTADLSLLGRPFDIVVCDVSFISLRTIRSQLLELGRAEATWLLLIKPQFEAGRSRVGKGGIIRDPLVRHEVLDEVISSYDSIGLGCVGLIESPITGASGNREYVACFKRTSGTVTSDVIEAIAEGASR